MKLRAVLEQIDENDFDTPEDLAAYGTWFMMVVDPKQPVLDRDYPEDLFKEVVDWCKKEFGLAGWPPDSKRYELYYIRREFRFYRPEDAFHFKLRWG